MDSRVTLDVPEAWGVFEISSVAGSGLDEALEGLWARVRAQKDLDRSAEEADPFESVEGWRP